MNTFSKIFVPADEIPFEVTNEIKQHNKKIYTEFIDYTEKEVENCFSVEKDLDRGERARQNDMFCRLMRENKFDLFDLNLVDKGEQINKKIV